MMRRRKRATVGRALLAAMMVGLAALALAACNTVRGIGQDISALADGGQNIIDDVSNEQ
jgi:predicted small secreted protein